jgi:hypothetical protein
MFFLRFGENGLKRSLGIKKVVDWSQVGDRRE